MPPTVVPASMRSHLGLLAGSTAFVLAGVFMIVSGDEVFWGVAAVAFFGLGIPLSIAGLIRRTPEMVVTDDGLRLKDGEHVAWSDVDSVGVRAVAAGPRTIEMLEFALRDPDAYITRLSGPRALAARANLAAGYSPLVYSSSLSGYALNRVLDILRRHHPELVVTSYPSAGEGSWFARTAKNLVKGRKKVLWHVIGWPVGIAVAFGVVTLYMNLTGDVSTVRVGKCVSQHDSDVKVVDCASAKANHKVIGQVERVDYADREQPALCDPYPGTEVQFWYGEEGQRGVIWCFGPVG